MPNTTITTGNSHAPTKLATMKLATFQQWMVSVVTHFGTDEEAWNSEEATTALSHARALENIIPTKDLNGYERIGIYRRMYFLRMRDALTVDFPAVQEAVGTKAFEDIVEQYCTQCPSTSYTLNDSGLKFPAFMRSSDIPGKEFLAELAELELDIASVMEAEEVPPLTVEEIMSVPPEAWANARFTPVAALKISAFRYPVYEYFREVEAMTAPETTAQQRMEEGSNYCYIHRSEYSTRHYPLSKEEYLLLAALIGGVPLQEAFDTVQDLLPNSPSSTNQTTIEPEVEQFQIQIRERFQEWMQMGVFAAIQH
ncbi:MAG: DNA-binding domain-containing protein [Candidatus Kapabacteria bacterium]|jgi:hypothetical protein|nr:DNA-binding domain-containing protein [Candidatus Kapabacteria bacterium]